MHAKRERERDLRFTSVIELMVVCGQGHLKKKRERERQKDKEKERNQRKERSELVN